MEVKFRVGNVAMLAAVVDDGEFERVRGLDGRGAVAR